MESSGLPAGDTRRIKVWRDELTAALAPAAINDWLAAAMGIPCQLVYMSKAHSRPLKSGYGRPEDDLSFADGASAMLIASESLTELNERLETSVEMKRFRPNLVVTSRSASLSRRLMRFDAVRAA